MRFLAIALSVFVIVSIANAGFESVSLKPFEVSFWLNTSERYSVVTSESNLSDGMTEYKIGINDLHGEEKAYITIDKSNTPQIQISPSTLADVLRMYWNESYKETNSTLLMIDGHPGFLVTANNSQNKSETAGFGYWLNDRTIVSARSTYDWDNGSESLIESIHITSELPSEPPSESPPFKQFTIHSFEEMTSNDDPTFARLDEASRKSDEMRSGRSSLSSTNDPIAEVDCINSGGSYINEKCFYD